MIRLKNKSDIAKIRESCALLRETFAEAERYIESGVTTEEIDSAVRDFIEKHGGRPAFLGYLEYPASICASINDVVIHGIPDGRKLKPGDILSLDLGIDLGGFYSDAAWTYPIGTVDPSVQKLLRVTQECLARAVDAAVLGNRIRHISRAVYDHATDHGFGVVHQFCGHGVGYDLHEDPQVPNYVGRGTSPRIKPGFVLAIEPMINMGTGDVDILDDDWTVVTADGALSAHYEHTVAVLEDHTEILTAREDRQRVHPS